jgi:hypothetical protein
MINLLDYHRRKEQKGFSITQFLVRVGFGKSFLCHGIAYLIERVNLG